MASCRFCICSSRAATPQCPAGRAVGRGKWTPAGGAGRWRRPRRRRWPPPAGPGPHGPQGCRRRRRRRRRPCSRRPGSRQPGARRLRSRQRGLRPPGSRLPPRRAPRQSGRPTAGPTLRRETDPLRSDVVVGEPGVEPRRPGTSRVPGRPGGTGWWSARRRPRIPRGPAPCGSRAVRSCAQTMTLAIIES